MGSTEAGEVEDRFGIRPCNQVLDINPEWLSAIPDASEPQHQVPKLRFATLSSGSSEKQLSKHKYYVQRYSLLSS